MLGIEPLNSSSKSFEGMSSGKFSKTKYEKFIITSGLTKPQYEKNIQDIESKGQLLNFYSGGIRLPDFVIKDLYVKENTLKKITFLDLNKVFFHLYYNAFQPGSMMDVRSRTIADPDSRVGNRIYHLKKKWDRISKNN